MAGSSDTIERNLVVCFENKCVKCSWETGLVPSSCKFGILHALRTDLCPLGVREMKRRSGKTTKLLRIANEVIASGASAILISPTHTMREHIHGMGMTCIGDNLKLAILSEVEQGRWSGFDGFVLADEIYGENLEIVERMMLQNPILAAYYTLPEHG